MKKYLIGLLALLLVIILGVLFYILGDKSKEVLPEENIRYETNEDDIEKEKDVFVTEVSENLKKSIVSISMTESVGSGIIWKITEEGLYIIANKHLLYDGIDPEVMLYNGKELVGKICYLSPAYDIGLVFINKDILSEDILRDITVARHPSVTEELSGAERIHWTVGEPVLQIGYCQKELLQYKGEVTDTQYMDLFNTKIIVTKCYTRAGMSGGGVFDQEGNLIGMISGGDVPDDSEMREADTTYSLPIELLEEIYKSYELDS